MQKRATRWTWGFLEIDTNGPKFVPLHPSMAEALRTDPLFIEICSAF